MLTSMLLEGSVTLSKHPEDTDVALPKTEVTTQGPHRVKCSLCVF